MHYLHAVARLKAGVTAEQAEANTKTIHASLAAQYPDTNKRFDSSCSCRSWRISPPTCGPRCCAAGGGWLCLADRLRERRQSTPCPGDFPPKGNGHSPALGASRGRILRQLLTESALLALAGGAAGMLLAIWGTEALAAFLPQNFPRAAEISPDMRVLAFTALVVFSLECSSALRSPGAFPGRMWSRL